MYTDILVYYGYRSKVQHDNADLVHIFKKKMRIWNSLLLSSSSMQILSLMLESAAKYQKSFSMPKMRKEFWHFMI